ncbi:hypothetical protein CAPTEDRAFT_216227 [Capitella teleta]|uniref:HMG box domain-containing protein n=1 Tax=Capitella teleta TaxID=283909 RepID=R7V4V8_CAPTE|nr:hypothetical protein CAPTEDRAFT_216227 [Capitella teleta]|eukprot:ELU13497.1 hypothetical protein CAPTEDRAFT_216227 [Capitella teleta]
MQWLEAVVEPRAAELSLCGPVTKSLWHQRLICLKNRVLHHKQVWSPSLGGVFFSSPLCRSEASVPYDGVNVLYESCIGISCNQRSLGVLPVGSGCMKPSLSIVIIPHQHQVFFVRNMYSNVEKQQDFLYSLARKKKEPKARMKIPTRPTNGWGTFVSHKKKQEPDLESAVIFRRAEKEWRNFSNSEREHWRRTAQESHPFVTPDFSDESIKKKAISHKLNAIQKLRCQSWLEENPQFGISLLAHCMASATGNAHVPYASITAGKMAVKLHGPLDLDVTKPPSKLSKTVRQQIITHQGELSMTGKAVKKKGGKVHINWDDQTVSIFPQKKIRSLVQEERFRYLE